MSTLHYKTNDKIPDSCDVRDQKCAKNSRWTRQGHMRRTVPKIVKKIQKQKTQTHAYRTQHHCQTAHVNYRQRPCRSLLGFKLCIPSLLTKVEQVSLTHSGTSTLGQRLTSPLYKYEC